jgi:diguanylate cyclase (GGDEF)-like protein/PAS domain S-box-containing protein
MHSLDDLDLLDLMRRSVLTVAADCSLDSASRQMTAANVSAVLVTDGQRPTGILTERAISLMTRLGVSPATPVAKVMNTPVHTILAGSSVREAVAVLLEHSVGHLPVVDEKGKVLGIVDMDCLLEKLGTQISPQGARIPDSGGTSSDCETHYRRLFERAADAILLLRNHQIVECNEKALSLFLDSNRTIIGRTPAQISPIEQLDGRNSEAAARSRINDALAGVPQGFEWQFQRGDNSVFDSEVNMASVTIHGETLVQAIVRDNSECVARRRRVEDEIRHLAFYDPLTGLANRTLLLDRLRQALAASTRNLRQGALLFIDLDNFKWLNDTLGHDQGDLLLQQVAQRLVACVRENDTVARFGGDEFVVMLEGLSDASQRPASQVQTVGEKILNALNQPYALAGNDYPITPSIGVTLLINHRNTVDELLKQADLAMYQAKAAGRNGLRFFDPSMQAALEQRTALVAELRLAVKEHRFLLYYQTQVNSDNQITGVEALLRWQHPERGLVSPATFIPLAEDTGLIRPMGYWVLEAACRQLAVWAGQPETRHLTLAVNVSTHQFRQTDFVDQVLTALARAGADPRKLKLELTESVLLDDVDAVAKMRALKARGVGFSLDDFGTGYSSLAYLKKLPLDELKIAQSFVRDILSDLNDAAIARTILSLGQTFGLAVIAEGVETSNQRAVLASYGCTAYQGYLFGEPGPAETLRLETVDSP